MRRKSSLAKCLLVGVIISSFILAACQSAAPSTAGESSTGSSKASSQTIKLAFIGPLTGPDGADGGAAANAAQVAVKLANEAGGICGGKTIEFEAHDTKSDPKEGASIATSLCSDESVYGVVADYNSSVSLAEGPILNECGLAQVNYWAAAPDIPKKGGPYIFRVYPPGQNMSIYLADWIAGDEGFTKIGVLYENTDYGTGLFKAFEEALKGTDASVVVSAAVLGDQTDLSAEISKFKSAEAEAVVEMTGYQVAAYWAIQSKEMGYSVPLFGADALSAPEYGKLAGADAEGTRTVASFSTESQDAIVSEFVSAYRTEFDSDPNQPGGYAYDAANLLIKSLDESGCSGREAVQQWLIDSVDSIKGVTGTISFDEYGEREFAPDLFAPIELTDGKWVEVSR